MNVIKNKEFMLLGYYCKGTSKILIFYNKENQIAKMEWKHNVTNKCSHWLVNVYDEERIKDELCDVGCEKSFFRYRFDHERPIRMYFNRTHLNRWVYVDKSYRFDYDHNNLYVCFVLNSENNLSSLCDNFAKWNTPEDDKCCNKLISYLKEEIMLSNRMRKGDNE